MTPLTFRQQDILSFIVSFRDANGYPPTVREIGAAFGIRSTNGVADHLMSLERKGAIRCSSLKARSIVVIDSEQASEHPTGRHAFAIARAAVAHMDSFNSDDDEQWDETRRRLDEAIADWRLEQAAARRLNEAEAA